MPMRTADRYLQRAGVRLRYRDDGTGPAIVMIHGWTLDLEMWDPQVELLAGSWRLVRLDRRGHGLSGGSPGPGWAVEDLTALCRYLGLAEVGVIGMSQGARSALAFASAAPATVRALVLDGPPDLDPGTAQGDIPLAHYRQVFQTQGIEAFRRLWQQHPHMRLRTHNSATRALLHAMLQRYDGRDLLDVSCDATPATTRMALESIRAPTLVLNGELDLDSRSAAADYLCRQLPVCERALIRGAGHLANLDNPADYAAAIQAFFTRHLPG